MAQRSTKGASKLRRDAINGMIAQIRELLPVVESTRCRLSQLQVMAMTNVFVGKTNFFERLYRNREQIDRTTVLTELFDMSLTLPGFLFMATADGKILYVSDSVSEYLGNSAVDIMTQMETIYEMIDERDRDVLRQAMRQHQQHVLPASSSPAAAAEAWMRDFQSRDMQISFTCRMNAGARGARTNVSTQSSMKLGCDKQKIMQIKGRFIQQKLPGYCSPVAYNNGHCCTSVLIACCTPHLGVFNGSGTMSGISSTDNIEGNTNAFHSLHHADMKFAKIEPNGEYHTGYSNDVIDGKSWYEMIHPADIEEARCKHVELIRDYQIGDLSSVKSICVRVQSARGDFLWLHVVMRIHDNDGTTVSISSVSTQPLIVCTNHVIDEQTAQFLRARENEMKLDMTARLGSPQSSYPRASSVGSSDFQIDDLMTFPDCELDEFLSPFVAENVQSPVKSQKRRYDDVEQNGAVLRQKIPKVVNEDPFGVNSSRNVVLSMPSPPVPPQWELDFLENPSKQLMPSTIQFTPAALTGNLPIPSGISNRGFFSGGFTTTPAGNGGIMSGSPVQIPEPQMTSLAESYMAVPDVDGISCLELDNVSTLYSTDPMISSKSSLSSVPHPVLGEYRPVNNPNVPANLPELDQSWVESFLEPLECVSESQGHVMKQVPVVPAGYSVGSGYNPNAMKTSVRFPQHHHHHQMQQQLLEFGDDESNNLIHEMMTLGQEFMESQFGDIYNTTSNPLLFV